MTRTAPAIHLTKGHGTGNDFLLFDDRAGVRDITASEVVAWADRHRGVGADGVIRLAPASTVQQIPDGAAAEIARMRADGHASATAGVNGDDLWFMDYRNADGSIAQMCGNGVRVLALFAQELGVHDFATGPLAVATRAGVRIVEALPGGWFRVGMGDGVVPAAARAMEDGGDCVVEARGLTDARRTGLSVDMGNPHSVVIVADEEELAGLDLSVAPRVAPVPPQGTNVEYVVALGERVGDDGAVHGAVTMRVHERGVGETLSCGTGACAAAVAARFWAGEQAPVQWDVAVPGGDLVVTMGPSEQRADGSIVMTDVTLAGPAVLVAEVDVR